ncbi:MAG: hypothetical protein ACLVAW_21390 [Eisenbergiella massiliensis]
MDTRTEMKIQEAMRRLMRGKPVLLSPTDYLRYGMPDIIVVNDGDVVQQGTHDELICQEASYRQMYLAQFE